LQAAFFIRQLRYRFQALEKVSFGAAGAANDIRGALGMALLRRNDSAYSALFEPRQTGLGPSGFANQPRPFVIRASHLDDTKIDSGETFQFDIHLFEIGEMASRAVEAIGSAFGQMAREGLGPRRGWAALTAVEQKDISIDLGASPDRLTHIKVEFVTPTELKSGSELAAEPEFPGLFARVRDRVSTLRTLYGGGAVTVDFLALAESARGVIMESCQVRRVDRVRQSSRTGQSFRLGGFVGEAIYSGHLAEFWPWLQAGEWTGVGRQTVWGKGQIRVTPLEDLS